MSESIRKIFLKLREDERGATLVEYGVALLVAIIAGGTFLTTLANETNSNFTDAGSAITAR
ncbi:MULTISPECIES: Flp family type IVb pilin [unclassified Ruegeria]|uniref:Flp family type IVb pilin n=1 Tax=unclassified Ruegeria TaxID=2625375 RepID=UPI0014888605|nr:MULTISPECIES: Flp family type IVb pilin [unclassified Ruegeria]